MGESLSPITARALFRALGNAGWQEPRRSRGSHVILQRADGTGRVVVPDHPGDLKIGTLRGILDQAGLTIEEFNGIEEGALMLRYSVLLIPDLESGGFTVRVPHLPEIVTEGDSEEEAIANARDAIALLLEEMTANGETSPIEPETPRVVQIDVDAASLPSVDVA